MHLDDLGEEVKPLLKAKYISIRNRAVALARTDLPPDDSKEGIQHMVAWLADRLVEGAVDDAMDKTDPLSDEEKDIFQQSVRDYCQEIERGLCDGSISEGDTN